MNTFWQYATLACAILGTACAIQAFHADDMLWFGKMAFGSVCAFAFAYLCYRLDD